MDRGEATGRKLGKDKPKAKPAPPPTLAMSIPQFCTSHNISEGMYYKMKKLDPSLCPREMKVGTRTLITHEAAAQWRADRQAASVVKHKAQPATPAKTVTPPTKPIGEVRRPEPLEHVEKPEPDQTRPAEPELLEPKARPTPATASKNTRPQSERAARYIKKNFPHGTEGITTAVIREKLAQDEKLQEELKKFGRELFSATVINRVLGRRKK